eukprot:4968668-Amphidinium_carterae.1
MHAGSLVEVKIIVVRNTFALNASRLDDDSEGVCGICCDALGGDGSSTSLAWVSCVDDIARWLKMFDRCRALQRGTKAALTLSLTHKASQERSETAVNSSLRDHSRPELRNYSKPQTTQVLGLPRNPH